MRTLLFAALFATGFSFTALPLPVVDSEPGICAGNGRDGGKKKKDEEKEEDYARLLKRAATVIS